MAGTYTAIPEDTFESMQFDAGVLLSTFDPSNPSLSSSAIICATTGGINAKCTPTYSDLGEDVDNCPENTLELKHLDGWDCSLSFTCIEVSQETILLALGAADTGSNSSVTPRVSLETSDATSELWWVGDRSDGGFAAVKLINALSTEGFDLQTTKNKFGELAMTLTGHVSITDQDTVPMVFYSVEAA